MTWMELQTLYNRINCTRRQSRTFHGTYSQKDMYEAGLYFSFVQDNQSMSTKGVLRGLHFPKEIPSDQAGSCD